MNKRTNERTMIGTISFLDKFQVPVSGVVLITCITRYKIVTQVSVCFMTNEQHEIHGVIVTMNFMKYIDT